MKLLQHQVILTWILMAPIFQEHLCLNCKNRKTEKVPLSATNFQMKILD